MAWIETHQNLVRHRKLYALAEALNIDRMQALGHLVALWLWAVDHAEDGNLEGYTVAAVEEAACWHKKPGKLYSTLCETGWLDSEENAVRIHDWDDYAGRLINQRAANRTRVRAARLRARNGDRNAHVMGLPDQTVPDRTEPAAAAGARDPADRHQRAYAAWDRQSPMGMNPAIRDKLDAALESGTTVELIEEACRLAGESGGRKPWRYVESIIERLRTGRPGPSEQDDPEFEAALQRLRKRA